MDQEAPRGWAGGGNWDPYQEPPAPPPRGPREPPKKAPEKAPAPREPARDPSPRPGRPETGLVAGRFDPPHVGHRFLIDFAKAAAAQLTVAVFVRGTDRLAGSLRCRWLRETYPGVVVVAVPAQSVPLAEDGAPSTVVAFESARVVKDVLRGTVQRVYSSERDGVELAAALDASHVMVDPERCTVPVAATTLFEDPLASFSLLLPASRAHVVRRVCLSGVSGVGKTWLARELAKRFETTFVPEYARTFDENVHTPTAEDVSLIADAQLHAEEAAARVADRVLFCDTGLAQIATWAELAFGAAPAWIAEEAARPRYDLHLLLEPEAPTPQQRRETDAVRARVEAAEDEIVTLRGPRAARLGLAVRAVEDALADRRFLSRWGRY
ncbi:MAG: AAA family ATPase [Sandaracinaceae bacterium]|nr:AAA family ATPase [Sandaracinaceae bacterium]